MHLARSLRERKDAKNCRSPAVSHNPRFTAFPSTRTDAEKLSNTVGMLRSKQKHKERPRFMCLSQGRPLPKRVSCIVPHALCQLSATITEAKWKIIGLMNETICFLTIRLERNCEKAVGGTETTHGVGWGRSRQAERRKQGISLVHPRVSAHLWV